MQCNLNNKGNCEHKNSRKNIKWGTTRQHVHRLKGISTKKIQRWKCNECGRTFIKSKKHIFTTTLKEYLVDRHVGGKSSYRDLERKHLSKKRICSFVTEYGRNALSAKELSQELKPSHWSGYIVVDAKVIKVKGRKHSIAIGIDYTGDIPVVEYEDSTENKSQYIRLFKSLKEIDYPLKGVVSDGNPDIFSAVSEIYPNISHQVCLKHFMRNIDRTFGYLGVKRKKMENSFEREIELRENIYEMIWSKTLEDFVERYITLLYLMSTRYKTMFCYNIWQKVEFNLTPLVARFEDPKLHRTNNLAENIIRQFNRRLKTLDGFNSESTARGYLKLLTTFWRCKPFTDSKYRYKNGKSRLEVSGVQINLKNWVKISQKK